MPGTNISSRHVLPDMFFGQILSTQRLKIGSISFKQAPTCWRPRPTGDLNCSHLPLFIICSTGIDVLIWKDRGDWSLFKRTRHSANFSCKFTQCEWIVNDSVFRTWEQHWCTLYQMIQKHFWYLSFTELQVIVRVKRRYFIFTVFWILINSFQKSTLFTDEDVRTMFSMFDITGRKTITSDQYCQGAPLFSPQHLSSFLFSLFQLRATCSRKCTGWGHRWRHFCSKCEASLCR